MSSIFNKNLIEEVDSVYGRIAFFQNDIYIGRSLREYGEWAQKELDFLRLLIKDDAIVVDAGAFIGTHTMAFSNFVGSQGLVYAFEPHPISFEVLQRNVSLNNLINVKAFNAGLSNQAGELQVGELDFEELSSPGSVQLGATKAAPNMLTIKVTTIDDLNLDACNLIKVDVEGMESLVLAGGLTTIKQYRPYVYAECNSADAAWPVVLMMRSLDYHIYLHSEEAYNKKNFYKNPLNIFGYARELALVCVPHHLDETFRRQLDDDLDLVRIDSLDDLVFCLIKKPQYKQDILANCSGTQRWGNDFWKNEVELEYLSDQIANLNQRVIERDEQIASLNQRVIERDEQIASLNQRVIERDEQIASLNQRVIERDEQIANINQAFSLEISRLNNTLSCIYDSKSWRITDPLRQLNRIASKLKGPHPIGGLVFNVMREIFRRIPLSNSAKDRLRFWVVARSGIFAGYKKTSSVLGVKDHVKSEGEFIEGTVDYVQFKRQLIHKLSLKQTAWMPRREKLLSFQGKDLRNVASSISFNPTTHPKVSLIIPVYGNASLTLECLASIQYSSVDTNYEIIVADDASTDETLELLELIKGIKIHRNSENKGFLRNCNLALPHAIGEFVVYLNNDVQVTDGWLDGLLEVFNAHPNAGAVGPMIVYPSGHLQEAGVSLRKDATADMVGLNDNPYAARFEYTRPVDYCSGACLIIRGDLIRQLGGFSDEFAPAYCEDADLCLRIIEQGYKVYYTHRSKVVHHLSKTTAADGMSKKLYQVSTNLIKLHKKWAQKLDKLASVKIIAFYLPQFHRIPENDVWWGGGFTEWTNVTKAKPNFVGHYQPRIPADLGYYDLNDEEVMIAQAALARKYGIDGFCFYYYWFGGKRLLEMPVERMLQTGKPDFPYCLCWANENWSRRWDGRDSEILIGQQHSPEDDRAVILDLIRHFKSPNYIRIDGRPHLIVYRVDLFPDFFATTKLWRQVCREQGIGDIYISMVESHDLVHKGIHPSTFGCDAAIEFPPLNMAEQIAPSGEIINPDFHGGIADYRDTALRYCTRDLPAYTRFRGVMPGWDNTARRQNNGFCFEKSSPEVFQAWMEHVIKQTREQHHGDERIIFVNAWNEWAEGAYLEPDSIHGHAFLESVRNAKDAEKLLSVGN